MGQHSVCVASLRCRRCYADGIETRSGRAQNVPAAQLPASTLRVRRNTRTTRTRDVRHSGRAREVLAHRSVSRSALQTRQQTQQGLYKSSIPTLTRWEQPLQARPCLSAPCRLEGFLLVSPFCTHRCQAVVRLVCCPRDARAVTISQRSEPRTQVRKSEAECI